jgi:low affinity Fe/Cu permease
LQTNVLKPSAIVGRAVQLRLARQAPGDASTVSAQHPIDRGEPGKRGPFDRFAQSASNFTSSPTFFGLCVVLVGVWLMTHVLGLTTEWQHLSGDALAAVALLLLALLKNSELRAEHAVQSKLDAIAAALLEQREGKTTEAHDDLERAIGMHEEV